MKYFLTTLKHINELTQALRIIKVKKKVKVGSQRSKERTDAYIHINTEILLRGIQLYFSKVLRK